MSINQTNYTAKDVQLEFARNISKRIGALVFPVPDGQIHRFDDPEGNPGNQACWYLLNLHPTAHGAYGNWRRNSKFGFRFSKQRSMSKGAIQILRQQIDRTRSERSIKKCLEQNQTAQTAQKIWETALPANGNHPYLLKKSIPPLYIKQIGSDLVIGLSDESGEIVNIQYINSNGRKLFLKGGRVSGCYALTGRLQAIGKLYVCEGWATGITLHLETGVPIACAMNCHNLRDAGNSLRQQYPNLEIVIAGDDDRLTNGNPGRTAAISAALALGSRVRFPNWPEGSDEKLTDFNDLHLWNKSHEPR
jgi:putative DNA primase/helicase